MLADMAERGWQAENCFIKPDETAAPAVERRLAEGRYDCVVIGAGVRLPRSRLVLFEALVNAIHRPPGGHRRGRGALDLSLVVRARGVHPTRAMTARQSPGWASPGKWRPSLEGREMKRVLLVGLDPLTVNFSDPALPPGMSAEKIHAGIKVARRHGRARLAGRELLH